MNFIELKIELLKLSKLTFDDLKNLILSNSDDIEFVKTNCDIVFRDISKNTFKIYKNIEYCGELLQTYAIAIRYNGFKNELKYDECVLIKFNPINKLSYINLEKYEILERITQNEN